MRCRGCSGSDGASATDGTSGSLANSSSSQGSTTGGGSNGGGATANNDSKGVASTSDDGVGDTSGAIQEYFDKLREKQGWESLFANDIVFSSMTSPVERVTGKDACLQATRPFYSMVTEMDVRDLLVDGERACVLTRYQVRTADGAVSE